MRAWCVFVAMLCAVAMPVSSHAAVPAVAADTAPTFDCSKASGKAQTLICSDPELAALDHQLGSVYAAASAKATNQHPSLLKVEQRGWIKGRDDCWKSDDVRGCVRDSYRTRIAELQARYQLVAAVGPVFYTCNGRDADEVIATFYATEPASAVVERGDRSVVMYRQPSASGAKYAGPNETLWEKGGEAMVSWGYQAPTMRCVRRVMPARQRPPPGAEHHRGGTRDGGS